MYFYYQINYSSTAVLEGQWLAITPNLFGQTPVRLILQKSDNKLERNNRQKTGWCFKKLTKHWREEKKMHTQQVQNTARVRSCLDMTIVNSLIVSLSLCPFAFSSFCLFVFLYFCLFVSHHSDQMSKGSHVYLCANSKVAVTDPVTSKGRDIELLKMHFPSGHWWHFTSLSLQTSLYIFIGRWVAGSWWTRGMGESTQRSLRSCPVWPCLTLNNMQGQTGYSVNIMSDP